MRLGRQRDDEIEIEPLPILEFLERHRLVARNILAEFRHHGDREWIKLTLPDAGRLYIKRMGEHLLQQACGHRRTHAVEAACEQYGLRIARARRIHAITLLLF